MPSVEPDRSPYRIPDPVALLAARIAARAERYEVAVFNCNHQAVIVGTGSVTYQRAMEDPLRAEHLIGVYATGADAQDIHADLIDAGIRR